MKKFKKILFCIVLFPFSLLSQELDLFNQIETDDLTQTKLLPDKMIFTQKFLWGEKGLARVLKISSLNIENREKELKLRRAMLKTHQFIGFLTFGGMIYQGILGGELYNGDYSLYDKHKKVGELSTIAYFTGAGLSLFTPPPLINKKVKVVNPKISFLWFSCFLMFFLFFACILLFLLFFSVFYVFSCNLCFLVFTI